MTADGVAGPQVWKALIGAVIKHQNNSFGYTFVTVSEASPETESTWHNGKTVSRASSTPASRRRRRRSAPSPCTSTLSVTMSGTNPDGSHYSDPGVP